MNIVRFITLCVLIASCRSGLAQQLEDYTPLQREKWLQDEQPLKLKVYGGISYDSNLFRLSDDADAQTAIGSSDKSDMIYQLGAGGKYEFRESRQKFIAEANVTEYKFHRFDDLDNTSDDLRGEWQWEVGNNWNGDLGIGQRRYLESFANFQQNVRDMVNQNRLYGSANYLVYSRLKLTAAADWVDTKHGVDSRNTLDSKTNTTTLAVNWITPAENSLGLLYRRADANFPNQAIIGTAVLDNSYTENEYSVVLRWRASGASDVFARLGYTKRTFEQQQNRDYSAPTWRVTYRWQPTGKTALEFTARRELVDFQGLTANYERITGFSVSPTWSVTPKLALRGTIARDNLEYLGNPGLAAVANDREDTDRRYQISALWTPLRLTELTFNIENGRRTSNTALGDYKYNAGSVLLTRYF
jgi:exopolysaccharide biosynthesis operon protein EpsL